MSGNYVQVRQIFEQMKLHRSLYQNEHLGTVNQFYGSSYLNQTRSYPSIVWVPTNDTFGPGVYVRSPVTVGGKTYELESTHLRMAGADLYLLAPPDQNTESPLELLINDTVQALIDVCGTLGTEEHPGGLKIQSGSALNIGGLGYSSQTDSIQSVSEDGLSYILSVLFFVPIYKLHPVGVAQSYDGTITLQEP